MAKVDITRMEGESEADFRRRYHRAWEDQDRRARGVPKRKTGALCSVDGCDRTAESKGMCGKHYRIEWNRRRTAKGPGKRDHPLYTMWHDRKKRGSLCAEWAQDFWAFVETVGERPSPKHLLRRPHPERPYDAGNWEWLDALKREPGESRKAFDARKWTSRRAREPEYESRRWLMRKYGITPEIYEEMYLAQGGVCATCRRPETAVHHHTLTPKALAVDHCHVTGKVRGLLCWGCNAVLGRVKDDPNTLRAMAAYLERATKKDDHST